ncbi:MAG: hypothetical protein HZA78_05745 [Candidatus Schekmanbacteria bacterium]|nr:hypothetical protein [Candidatus Schekmanbacteria bacterium]
MRLDAATALADGSLAQTERFLSDEFWKLREENLNSLHNCRGKLQNILALSEKLSKEKTLAKEFLLLANLWYRDLLFLKLGLGGGNLINQDKEELLQKQAGAWDVAGLQNCLQQIQEAFSAFQYNANPRLILENTLINLKP